METYQFPLIADERQAGSTLLQRLALVDVGTDREVSMLYSSFLPVQEPGRGCRRSGVAPNAVGCAGARLAGGLAREGHTSRTRRGANRKS